MLDCLESGLSRSGATWCSTHRPLLIPHLCNRLRTGFDASASTHLPLDLHTLTKLVMCCASTAGFYFTCTVLCACVWVEEAARWIRCVFRHTPAEIWFLRGAMLVTFGVPLISLWFPWFVPALRTG
jgi:hypothetical protein